MRHGKILLLIVAISTTLCTWNAYAQGGGSTPPPCCKNEDPPPPGGDSIAPTVLATDSILVVTVADATLESKGMTRSQFLDLMAAALLDPSAGPVSLVIPIVSQVAAADGSITYRVSYFTIEKSMVSAEVIDTLDALYLTDGQTVIGVNFIPLPPA